MGGLHRYSVVRRPVLTEKSTDALEHRNAYVFEVAPAANKIQIRQAIEEEFDVKVRNVNTLWKRGKARRVGRTVGRTASVKEAIVTLRPGDKIDVY
jgi:large subunit ribosomal protein L23